MYYPDIKEYITFLFLMLDEFLATQEESPKRGRPETYSDASLIVFYTVMTLKGITAMRAQQDYLFHHPLWKLERCQLPACPSHVTLGRRYKTLTPTLEAFTEYIAASRFTTEARFLQLAANGKSIFFFLHLWTHKSSRYWKELTLPEKREIVAVCSQRVSNVGFPSLRFGKTNWNFLGGSGTCQKYQSPRH